MFNLERFTKDRWLSILVYILIGLLIILLLIKIWPLIRGMYGFLKTILAPFLIALVISYVLNPVVGLLTARRVPRTLAVLTIYAVFITSISILLVNMIPMFVKQLAELNEHLPDVFNQTQMMMDHVKYNSMLPQEVVQNSFLKLESTVSRFISGLIDNIGATINVLFIGFIVPFVAFYILKDFQLIEKTVLTFVPKGHRKQTIRIVLDIDKALGNYIRGQFIVCMIIGIFAYIGYWFIGLPYALLLAAIVAVFNIIPYLGPFFGAAPALIVASTISVKMVLYVVLVNTACQILEGNIISPQVVGRSLQLHPLVIIFAVLVGGEVAGVIGMILAVPFVAVMKVVLQHVSGYWIKRRTV